MQNNIIKNIKTYGKLKLTFFFVLFLFTIFFIPNGRINANPVPSTTIIWSAVGISDSQIKVMWNESAYATRYELTVDGANVPNIENTLMWVVGNLSPSRTYTFRVRAVNNGTYGNWSAPATGTTLPSQIQCGDRSCNGTETCTTCETDCGVCQPSAPTNLSAGGGVGLINLNWSAGNISTTGYKIYRSASPGVTTANLYTTIGYVTTFTDNGLPQWTTYYYKVAAYNAAGTSFLSLEVSARTNDTTFPVTNYSFVNYTSGNWTNNNVTVNLSPTDTGSGIATTYYCIDSYNNCTPSYVGINITVTCPSGSSCQKYVRYFSVDNAGNIESPKSTSVIMIDKAGPTGGYMSYADGYTSNGYVDMSYSPGYDSEVGMRASSSFSIERDYTSLSNGTCGTFSGNWFQINSGGAFNGYRTTLLPQIPGCYKYRYVVYDSLNNQTIYTTASVAKVVTNPGAPTLQTVVPISSSEINLTWSAPTNNGGAPISSYTIERCVDDPNGTHHCDATDPNWGVIANPTSASPYIDASDPTAPKSLGTTSGSQTLWVCQGSYGGIKSDICVAQRLGTPTPGVCGSATTPPTTYAYDGNPTTISANLCYDSTPPSTQTLPAPEGSSVSWTCAGLNGGIQSPSCTATRGFAPYCGDGIKNGGEACDTGDFPGDVDSGGCSGGQYCTATCTCSSADAPEIDDMSLTTNYCGSTPDVTFEWTYIDTNIPSLNETQYKIEVSNDDPNFSPGNIDFTENIPNLDLQSGAPNKATARISKNPADANTLNYDSTYHWRVKVYNSQNRDSGWVVNESTFKTPAHLYPSPEFTVDPASKIIVNNHAVITFTDESQCFNDNQEQSACRLKDPPAIYSWIFGDGTSQNYSYNDTELNYGTTHDYKKTGKFTTELTVCDNSLDPVGCCRAEEKVEIVNPGNIPEWKEVSPF